MMAAWGDDEIRQDNCVSSLGYRSINHSGRGGTFGCLKLIDNRLLSHRHPSVPDEDADPATMRTMENYPFTGEQIQAYMRQQGRLPWLNYDDDFDVVSGEYGFFIDFRLEAPPPKQDHEIRIVLTGGSAAQGWGGRTNADMFYKLLPVRLDQRLREGGQSCKVTVINLAMAASHIYQNFIVLNKWAHALQPDAILSFSGHNEIYVPRETRSDADFAAALIGGFAQVLRYSASPHWLKVIARYYPGIVRRTVMGPLIRFMYLDAYKDEWQANYFLSRTDPSYRPMPAAETLRRYQAAAGPMTTADIVRSVSIPLYEHAIESISRDFPDTPVFAVFQPLHGDLEDGYAPHEGGRPGESSGPRSLWQRQICRSSTGVGAKRFFLGSFADRFVHLSNSGHVLVAKYLSDSLFPFVRGRCEELAAANAAPAR